MHPAYRRSLNPPLDRPIWPWVVGGIAVAGLMVGALFYSRNAQAAVTGTQPTPSNGNGAQPSNGNGTTTPTIPTIPDLPPPMAVTQVQDPVTGQIYNVPMPSSPRRIRRSEAGVILPTPQLLLGQRAGFIEAWPTGAEMLWGHVRNVGPARAFYDVEVAESIPYQGAYHDTRPSQLADHQTPAGQTVRIASGEVVNAIV